MCLLREVRGGCALAPQGERCAFTTRVLLCANRDMSLVVHGVLWVCLVLCWCLCMITGAVGLLEAGQILKVMKSLS